MLSKTEIFNLVLMDVGVPPAIVDWDEESNNALYIRTVWDQVIEEALASHSWRFATKQVQLQRSLTAPAARYEYAYALPADYVRLGNVSDSETLDPPLRYYAPINVDGRTHIAADAEYVFIDYVYNAPAIGYWPRYFAGVVSAMAAVPVSNAVKTVRQDLDKLVQQRLARAKSLDSIQMPPRRPPLTGWQRAYRGERQ